MTEKEIVQALRCSTTREEKEKCEMRRKNELGCLRCFSRSLEAAVNAIERLRAENAALLEYAKTMQECEMCKNDSFCHLRDPMKDDCEHCQRASDCPCQKCKENNCWEWRGLLEVPEEGEKA